LPNGYSYRLEDMPVPSLTLAQRLFRPLAFGHVHIRADNFNKIAGRVENGMAYRVDVLESAVRKNRPENPFEVCPFTDCSLEDFGGPGSIVGMNVPVKFFE
jgi:hypothetical protein